MTASTSLAANSGESMGLQLTLVSAPVMRPMLSSRRSWSCRQRPAARAASAGRVDMRSFMTLAPRLTAVATVVFASVLTSTGSLEAQEIRRQPLPLVYVLATGGTIAGRGASTGVSGYKSGALAAEELVKAV